MLDEDMQKLLADVTCAVEANSFEHHALWVMHHYQAELLGYRKSKWVQNVSGRGVTVGHIKGKPVFVSLLTAEIDDKKVLFYYPTSQMVDYEMVEKWLEENLPKSAFREDGYLNKTDASNFHVV